MTSDLSRTADKCRLMSAAWRMTDWVRDGR